MLMIPRGNPATTKYLLSNDSVPHDGGAIYHATFFRRYNNHRLGWRGGLFKSQAFRCDAPLKGFVNSTF